MENQDVTQKTDSQRSMLVPESGAYPSYQPPCPPTRIKSDWTQFIAIVLTMVGMVVGAAIYTTNADAEIKDWTVEQDFVTKEELKEIIKEQYVPKHEFAVVKSELKNLNDKLFFR